MKSAAQVPQVSAHVDPTNDKTSALKVVQGAMHARHGIPRRVSHRVDSTCKRGGRLNDQKKRQLVQKLFQLWIRKTFGQVHPSEARTHYQQKVLQNAFEAWREEWWETRREWRLCMRAECHYRHRLYNWIFINWRQFVAMQKEHKERNQMAAIYAEGCCLRLAWKGWVVYLKMQRIKRNNQDSAQKQWENTALRSAWMQWRARLRFQNQQHVLEECALQHWALLLQGRAWQQWREVYLLACSQREEEARASLHHSHGLQRRALFAWTSYLQYRQAKKEKKVLGSQARHCMTLRRYWSTWQDSFSQRQNERAAWQAASALSQQRVQLQALHRWKGYTIQCLDEARRIQSASEHYKGHLMRRGLTLLTQNVLQHKTHQMNKHVALQQYRHSVLAKYWHGWQESYEEIEERNHQQQRNTAITYYSMNLLKNTLHCWRKRFTEHKIGKEMEHRADSYYARWALPQFFDTWREYIARKKETRERVGAAEAHVRQWTFNWVFYTWLARSEEQRDNRLAERMAVLHADQSTLLRVFVHWRSRADLVREEREKCEASEKLYLHILLQKTLWGWRDNIAQIQSGRENEQRAVRHDHLLCAHKALAGWRKYVQHRRGKKRIVEKCDRFYHCKLLARALHGWKEYHQRVQQANHIAEVRERLHHQNLLRTALCTWRENVTLLVRDKAKENRASKQYQLVLLSKVLLMWREATVHAIYSRHQQEEELTVARTYLNAVRLQQMFQRWKKQAGEVQRKRLSMEKARQHHQTALLHRCLGAWVLHCHRHRQKKVLQEQSNCLLQLRTCLHYFTFWKRQLKLRYEEAERTDVALWHWSFKLLAKVMDAWRWWVSERRRKRDRLAYAAQFHRDQLLRQGVACILSHTAYMRSFRISLALQSQEQCARRLQNVVWRCAMLWKRRALGEPRRSWGKNQKKSVSFSQPPLSSTPGSTSQDDTVGQAIEQGSAGHSSDQLCFGRTSRLQPRRPEHLLGALDKESPHESKHNKGTMPRTDKSVDVLSFPPCPENPNQTKARAPEIFCSPATAQEPLPGLQDHSTNQEVLLPPSSFMASGVRQHGTSTLMAHPEHSYSDVLHSPQTFTMRQTDVPTGSPCEECKPTGCKPVDHQPYGHASSLGKELLCIQQKMCHYQCEKRQLQAWRRLADVLRSWLQTSASEDEADCHSTRLELEELEARMRGLATWLEQEKPVMQCYAARIRSISRSLRENNL